MAASPALAPSFPPEARAAQATFRTLMDAMARPARAVPFATTLAPPAPLTGELAALALSLLDFETPVFLDTGLASAPDVARFLRFHTGAPLVSDPADARFALISAPRDLPPFSAFAQGEADYPDRSATLLFAVGDLAEGPYTFEGPGIRGQRGFGSSDLPADFADRWRENGAIFPLGLDLVLAAPGRIAALPRSSRLIGEA